MPNGPRVGGSVVLRLLPTLLFSDGKTVVQTPSPTNLRSVPGLGSNDAAVPRRLNITLSVRLPEEPNLCVGSQTWVSSLALSQSEHAAFCPFPCPSLARNRNKTYGWAMT